MLTMAEGDINSLSGGLQAAERAFESHLPKVLTFEGIETEDEGYSATFTLEFDDTDDYQRKITELLDASGVPDAERDMTIQVDQEDLTSSVVFEESFYNDDLMGWAADALIQEAVVSESATILTSSGTATVVFDGQEVDTSTSLPRIDFRLTEDRRFEEIGLDFEIFESGEINVALSYLISSEAYEAQNAFLTEQVERLRDRDDSDVQITDSGPVNSQNGQAEQRDITATFTSAAAVTEGMQMLLANEETTFEIREETTQGSPDTSVRYIGENWNCDAICNPNNIQQLNGETVYPEHWEVTEQRRDGGDLLLEFNRGMPLDSLTSLTQLKLSGGMTQTFEFVVDNATQQGHEDVVAERFVPPEGTGSFDTTVRETTTVYTASFEAPDAAALTSQLNQYLTAKSIEGQVTLEHDTLTGLWADYDLHVDLSPIWELATGGVEGTALFEAQLPIMHAGDADTSVESGRTVVIDDTTGVFTVTASGPTVLTYWAVAFALLIVAVLVTLLVRLRRSWSKMAAVTAVGTESLRPYNVQGPKDQLTETDIYASPLAPGAHDSDTTELARGRTPHDTDRYQHTGPFPDVPNPSEAEYEQLQDKLDQPAALPQDDASSASAEVVAPEDGSEEDFERDEDARKSDS